MKPFIGLKNVWYGPALETAPAKLSDITALLTGQDSKYKKVSNVHDGTWSYTQDDPTITDYINMLTGQPYFRDITNGGNRTIAFTMGEYEFTDLVALQGGSLVDNGNGWASGAPALIYAGIIAETKTGNYIVFSNAGVVGKTNAAEQNLGLGVTAVAMDSDAKGVAAEYRFKATSTTPEVGA